MNGHESCHVGIENIVERERENRDGDKENATSASALPKISLPHTSSVHVFPIPRKNM